MTGANDQTVITGNTANSVAAADVTLEPGFPLASQLWKWLNQPREPNFDDFGPRTFAGFYDVLLKRSATEKTWAIHWHGKIVGYLAFAPLNPVSGQFHGLVIAPEYRRRGFGRAALKLALAELRRSGFRSLLVMPFRSNHAIRYILQELGFQLYGWMEQASEQDGKPQAVGIFVHNISMVKYRKEET